jgi:hypothetical protein
MTHRVFGEDSRDAEVLIDPMWRVLESGTNGQRRNLFVRAEHVLYRERMGQRFHTLGVQFVQLIDVIEDCGELLLHPKKIGI